MILMKVQMWKLVYYIIHGSNANLSGISCYLWNSIGLVIYAKLSDLGEGIFYHNKKVYYNKNI